jgi:hypothetical protein
MTQDPPDPNTSQSLLNEQSTNIQKAVLNGQMVFFRSPHWQDTGDIGTELAMQYIIKDLLLYAKFIGLDVEFIIDMARKRYLLEHF